MKEKADQNAPPLLDLGALLEAYQRPLLRHLEILGASPDEADDILQDALIRAMTKQEALLDPEKAFAWLKRIAENLYRDRRRKAKGIKFVSLDELERKEDESVDGPSGDEDVLMTFEDPLKPAYWKYSPERVLLERERMELLQKLATVVPTLLTQQQRLCFLLYFTEGLSYREIAQRLGITESTVRVQISKGMERVLAVGEGRIQELNIQPLQAWQDQAQSLARAEDLIAAADAYTRAGWMALHGLELYGSDSKNRDHFLGLVEDNLSQATKLYSRHNHKAGAGHAWSVLGRAFHCVELYGEARDCYSESVHAFQAANQQGSQRDDCRLEEALAFRDLACAHTGLANFHEAQVAFKRALKRLKRLDNTDENARTLAMAAELYVKQGLITQARRLHLRALKLSRRCGSDSLEALIRQRLQALPRAG